jgi:hypothetical protein
VAKKSTRQTGRPTLREAMDAFLSSSRCANPSTRRAYTAVLDRCLADLGADLSLAEVSGDDLAGVLARAWGDAGPATWNRNRAAVSSWLAWCTKNGWNAPGLPLSWSAAPSGPTRPRRCPGRPSSASCRDVYGSQ